MGRLVPAIGMKSFNFKMDPRKVQVHLSGSLPFDILDTIVWVFKSVILKSVTKIINNQVPGKIE
jgi:hypothetical protein